MLVDIQKNPFRDFTFNTFWVLGKRVKGERKKKPLTQTRFRVKNAQSEKY
jgi:hypothetical protein